MIDPNFPTENQEVEPLATLLEGMKSLSSKFEALQQEVHSKIKYHSKKDGLIETLHKELEVHREGMHLKILRPLFLDLIAMHDDMSRLMRQAKGLQAPSESEPSASVRNLLSFRETVEDILERHGVDIYSEEGEQFISRRQRVIKTIEIDQPEKDKLVAFRLGKGFEYDGRVLRPELVATFRYSTHENQANKS